LRVSEDSKNFWRSFLKHFNDLLSSREGGALLISFGPAYLISIVPIIVLANLDSKTSGYLALNVVFLKSNAKLLIILS
jgi:hypothetical protein